MDPQSSQEQQSAQQAGRLPPVSTLPSLTQAVEAARTPQFNEPSTPTTADLLPTATYMPGNGDYFGEAWSGLSPVRAQKAPERSPGAPYLSSPATDRIQPGAGNSYAESPPKRFNTPTSRSAAKARDDNSSPRRRQSRSVDQTNGETEYSTSQARRRKPLSQKAMLAKALEKANHAVVLDNAQNFEGAMAAYTDACELLQQVMMRSSGNDDKKKLDTIVRSLVRLYIHRVLTRFKRSTYKARIKELQAAEPSLQVLTDKALPEVPKHPESQDAEPFSPITDEEEPESGAPTITRQAGDDEAESSARVPSRPVTRDQLPPRRTSLMPRNPSHEDVTQGSNLPLRLADNQGPIESTLLSIPMQKDYMPPPLSPRRASSPTKQEPSRDNSRSPRPPPETLQPSQHGHARQETAESTSWLDTIDESGGSSNSSVHSRASYEGGLRRKHIRRGSGDTEAEFDTALDAAIEAAYDEGYEPASDSEDIRFGHESLLDSSRYRRNVDIAKQRVRDAEREHALAFAERRDSDLKYDSTTGLKSTLGGPKFEDEEADEEERILDEMTRDFMDDRDYDSQSKSALPRESDSSSFSGRTWGSSVGSMPTTHTSITPLSTVAESSALPSLPSISKKTPSMQANGPPAKLPPLPGAMSRADLPPPPPIPKNNPPGPPIAAALASPALRERRLSGQKQFTQLYIDTGAKPPSNMTGPKTQPLSRLGALATNKVDEPPKPATFTREVQLEPPGSAYKQTFFLNSGSARQASSPFPTASPSEPTSGFSEGLPAMGKVRENNEMQSSFPPPSPVRTSNKSSGAGLLRKNFSSSSLKSLRQTAPPPVTEDLPGTPLTRVFSSSSAQKSGTLVPSIPDLPTPSIANFAKAGNTTGSLSFFDSDIHSPHEPGSPNPLSSNGPAPLEPCPESFLLRPFWLMRAIYQTINNPRGGYLSTRLFVPRDIWRVKNVKLKYVEEKIDSCDILTAALQNISRVDDLDADQILEQVQAFELTLDSVQSTLVKKLGSDVGLQGAAAMFKTSPATDGPRTAAEPQSAKTSTKSYFGLKRLGRPKASLGPGPGAIVLGNNGRDAGKDNLTMPSLPMTNQVNSRLPRRENDKKVLGIGPNAYYMASLARLCQAAQVLGEWFDVYT